MNSDASNNKKEHPKPKVVFDTNIYISALIFGGNAERCLELAENGEIKPYTSNNALLELSRVLRNKFQWPEPKIKKTVQYISHYSTITTPQKKLRVVKKDPSDNKILEIAKEAGADFLITSDKHHLLPLKKFKKTKILSPAEFLKTFKTSQN